MLVVNLQALHDGPVGTDGELPADDPLFEDVPARLAGTVAVSGLLAMSGRGHHFWRGELRAVVSTECRRCLEPLKVPLRQPVEALFCIDREVEDDPSVYPVDERATEIDLRPAVREELILAVPQFSLCRPDCRGLCPGCGANLNAGPCTCRAEPDPRWGELLAQWPHDPET
jgi:uncharacterized protein